TDILQADEVKLVENTPLRAVIRVTHKWQSSSFVQDITLYAGMPRVDVHMQADWHEKHILLKVAFPLSARHEFTYALYPHAGTWREALTVRQGYEVNYPLMATTTARHQGTLPPSQSFFAT